MRLILKTFRKVIIEVHSKEIEKNGFDALWDKIRDVYKVDKYEIFNVDKSRDKSLVYIELVLVD